MITAYPFNYGKCQPSITNCQFNCQLHHLLWKWMETETSRYLFHKINWFFLDKSLNFCIFISSSEKIAKKNQMEQLELRPLNRTDQFVALENLSVKTVTTKISL